MESYIKWTAWNKNNLYRVYADEVSAIEDDIKLNVVSNVLCLVKYKKPRIKRGLHKKSKVKYIDTKMKVMSTTLLIKFDGTNGIEFVLGAANKDVIMFCPMEKALPH